MGEKFSKLEALRFGWQAMKANLGFWVGLMLLVLGMNALPELGRWQTQETAPLLALFWTVSGYLIQMATQMGLIRISLILLDGRRPRYSELFGDLVQFFRYIVGNLLFVLIILVGVLLLIIPGILWSIKYQFAPFLIVDRGLGVTAAFRESSRITSRSKGDLFLFFLLAIGLNLFGLLAFAIGLFTTLPATMIAYTYIYRKLLEGDRRADPVQEETEVLSPNLV